MNNFPAPMTRQERAKRMAWCAVRAVAVRWLPPVMCFGWVRMVYRFFGAKVAGTAKIYPSADVFMPWNLEIGAWSTIGGQVHILNAAPFVIGQDCNVSEWAYICCASHNIRSDAHEQIHKPVVMKDRSWVAAEDFVGMGVTIGEGAVVGARAAVFKDVEAWTVVGGNPANVIKERIITNNRNMENTGLGGAILKFRLQSFDFRDVNGFRYQVSGFNYDREPLTFIIESKVLRTAYERRVAA